MIQNKKMSITDIEKKIQTETLAEFTVQPDDFKKMDLKEQYIYIYKLLDLITSRSTTISYSFVILITKLQEKYSHDLLEPCYMILANDSMKDEIVGDDVAFAAFYLAALYYYRQKDIEKLRSFIQKYYKKYVDKYPLTYEIFVRYAITNDDAVAGARLSYVTINKVKESITISKDIAKAKASAYIDDGDSVSLKIGFASSMVDILDYCFARNDLEYKADKGLSSFDIKDFKNELDSILEKKQKERVSSSLLSKDDLIYTIDLLNAAIAYNPNYPKYHYLLAKATFYQQIVGKKQLSSEKRNEILVSINTALEKNTKDNKDYENIKNQYESFKQLVDEYSIHYEDYLNSNNAVLRLKDEIIRSDTNKECEPHRKALHGNHIFISYQSSNFKSVYCDLVEMDNRGISYDYDEDLISCRDFKSPEWYNVVREKISQSDVIFCYLSEAYIQSPACIRELEIIQELGKDFIAIDLTGLCAISKIIEKVIKGGNRLPSKSLKVLAELFSDDNSVIVRPKAFDANTHFVKISSILLERYPKVISYINSESITKINNVGHPMEDVLIEDKVNHIYITLDGITRPECEYEDLKYSASYELSFEFANILHTNIKAMLPSVKNIFNVIQIMKEAFAKSVEEINRIRDKFKYNHDYELPGCAGVVGVIYQNVLIYAGFGDSEIFIIRHNQTTTLFKSQTECVFKRIGVEANRPLLYEKYVNIPNIPYGYGVVNGDEGVSYYFNPSYIELNVGDNVYLCTDGIASYIKYTDPKLIKNQSVKVMIAESEKLDKLINKNYIDDKALIKITVGEYTTTNK